jgi:glyoxylate reductase
LQTSLEKETFVSKPLVLVDIPLPPFLQEMIEGLCETCPWKWLQLDRQELNQVKGIYTYGHAVVSSPLTDRLPALKVISNFGVGVDHIDLAAASSRNIPVGNTPGVLDGATADLTMALILATARNVVVGDNFARGPEFVRYDPSHLLGAEMFGSTLGIVGLGRIGSQVARRASGFDMHILYHNRRPNFEVERILGVKYAGFDELLAESHFVTLNVPLTPETVGLIAESQLRRMRRDAILINVARGAVVDHTALYRALTEKWIAAAAIDVTDPEPLPRDHPLLRLTNLVITPHLGSATWRTRRRMGEMTTANLVAGLSGQALPHQIRS